MATTFTRRGVAPEQVSSAEVDKLHSRSGSLWWNGIFWPMPRRSVTEGEELDRDALTGNDLKVCRSGEEITVVEKALGKARMNIIISGATESGKTALTRRYINFIGSVDKRGSHAA